MLRSFFICQQLEAVVSKAVLSRVSRMLIHEHRGSTQNKNLFFLCLRKPQQASTTSTLHRKENTDARTIVGTMYNDGVVN